MRIRNGCRAFLAGALFLFMTVISFDRADAQTMQTVAGAVFSAGKATEGIDIYTLYEHDIYYNYWEAHSEKVSVTGPDGSFRIQIPDSLFNNPRMGCSIIAGNSSFAYGGLFLGQNIDMEHLRIDLLKSEKISGKVVDTMGKPIVGAEVKMLYIFTQPSVNNRYSRKSVSTKGTLPGTRAITGGDGSFTLSGAPETGSANIRVKASGFAEYERMSVPAGMPDLAVILTPEGRIRGKVVYRENGNPAENIQIHALSNSRTRSFPGEARTDSNGEYILDKLSPGAYTVYAGTGESFPGWVAEQKDNIPVEEGRTVEDVNLSLIRGGIITGHVTETETGQPIANWGVYTTRAQPVPGAAMGYSTTDKQGVFNFRTLPGKMRVSTSAPKGYEDENNRAQIEKQVEVTDGGTETVDFSFVKVPLLKGLVIGPDKKPVAGAKISDKFWRGEPVFSDSEGKFSIPFTPGRILMLTAEVPEKGWEGSLSIEGQAGKEATIQLEKTGKPSEPAKPAVIISCRGKVVDEEGNPVAGKDVELMVNADNKTFFSFVATITDGSGNFTLHGLETGSKYQVRFDGGQSRSGEIIAQADMKPLVITLRKAARWLEGDITDPDGKPVAGARIIINGSPSGFKEMNSDARGHFRLNGLVSVAEPSILISHPNYGSLEFNFVETNQKININFPRVADHVISGMVVDTDGTPVAGARVTEIRIPGDRSGHQAVSVLTDVNGKFTLGGLLLEQVTVEVTSDRYVRKMFESIPIKGNTVTFVLKKENATLRTGEDKSSRGEKSKNTSKPDLTPELSVDRWLNCNEINLKELQGTIVVLNFWTSKDAGSVDGAHLMEAIKKEYGKEGFTVIGVHEYTDEIDALQKSLRDNGLTYPVAIDGKSLKTESRGKTFDAYNIERLPSCILLGRDGRIIQNIDLMKLEFKILDLLSQEKKQ